MNKFENNIQPSTNPIFARHIFHQQNQGEGETIELHITQLKVLANVCEFDNLEHQLVPNQQAFGEKKMQESTNGSSVRLTLGRAIECSSATETVQETQALMVNKHVQTTIKQEVEVVQRQRNFPSWYFYGGLYSRNHKCPAKGKQCSKRRKIQGQHFAIKRL